MLERSSIETAARIPSQKHPGDDRCKSGDRPAGDAQRSVGEQARSVLPQDPIFGRILVAVDDSEPAKAALEVAARLAGRAAASVKLVFVVEPDKGFSPEFAFAAELGYQMLRSEGQWLRRRAQKSLNKSVRSTWDLRSGDAADQILLAAREWAADVIVIGTHGRGRLGTLLLGSTAQAVVTKAPCPVLVVGPHSLNPVKAFLKDQHISFSTILHKPRFTANDTASTAHVPRGQFAKTLLVKLDGQFALAVVPADRRLDLELLRGATGAIEAKLADEAEVKAFFSHCEVGAMPPLGHLYGLDVYVDLPLSHQPQIAFNGGTHDEAIQMPYREFEKLSRTQIVEISTMPQRPTLIGALQI
jgi:Ala-tRNA(Pro) deacylase